MFLSFTYQYNAVIKYLGARSIGTSKYVHGIWYKTCARETNFPFSPAYIGDVKIEGQGVFLRSFV